jgi:hypothetical protein
VAQQLTSTQNKYLRTSMRKKSFIFDKEKSAAVDLEPTAIKLKLSYRAPTYSSEVIHTVVEIYHC